jgi:hypothetical protein
MKLSFERLAASSGILFAILFVTGGLLPGSPSKWNASAMDIESYLQGKNKELVAGSIIVGIGYILFLWFLSAFAGVFREAGQDRAATVMYGAGIATVAIAAVGDGLQLGLAKVTYTADPGTVAALYGVTSWLYGRVFWTAAALAFAVWIATRRSKALPAWYGLLSLAAGCVFVLGGVATKDTGFASITGGMGFVAFLGFAVWIAISSLLLMQRTAEAPAAAPAMS